MNPFFIIFIGIPAIEIFLLIKIGGQLGALNTVALIFITAMIGIYFAKLQGIQTITTTISYQLRRTISIVTDQQAQISRDSWRESHNPI